MSPPDANRTSAHGERVMLIGGEDVKVVRNDQISAEDALARSVDVMATIHTSQDAQRDT